MAVKITVDWLPTRALRFKVENLAAESIELNIESLLDTNYVQLQWPIQR